MSIGGVVTQGFLVSPAEVVTLGYSSSTPPLNTSLITNARRLGSPGIVQRGGPGFGGKVARVMRASRFHSIAQSCRVLFQLPIQPEYPP